MFNQVSWSSRPVFGQTSQVMFGSTWSSCSKGRRSSSINPKAAQAGSDGSRTNMYSVVKPVCSDPKKGPNWQFVPYHPEFEIKMSTCNSHLTTPLSPLHPHHPLHPPPSLFHLLPPPGAWRPASTPLSLVVSGQLWCAITFVLSS